MLKDRLRAARKAKGMTQQALADAIGVKKSTVCGYEIGNSEPDMAKMVMIMNALDVDANFLFQDDVAEATRPAFSNKALDLASMFDSLDEHGQEIVLAVARIEFNRIDLECAAKGIDIIDMISAKRLGTINGVPLYDAGDPAVAHAKYYARAERSEMEAEESKTGQSRSAQET